MNLTETAEPFKTILVYICITVLIIITVQMLPYKTLFLIDRNASTTLYIQLCNAFISLIGKGILKANDVLPSSRKLSEMLTINRNTVELA